MFGLDYTVFRPHNVYGERQNIADRYRNVIGIFMNNVLRGEPMPVFGDGLQTRAFSHVDDVAPVIARSPLVAGAANEVFNIGADTPYTILELAEEIAAAFDVAPRSSTCRARNEVVHAFSDHAQGCARLRRRRADRPADRHRADGGVGQRVRRPRAVTSPGRSRSSATCLLPGGRAERLGAPASSLPRFRSRRTDSGTVLGLHL